jgi:putative zinc finger protein
MSDNFDRLLVRAERRERRVRSSCPDAAALAAYLDGTLASADRARVEDHAADCSRCAMQLATIVRLEDEARESRPGPAAPRWRRFLWAVPVATAAVAAIVYVAAPSRPVAPGPASEARSAPPASAAVSRPEAPPFQASGSSPQILADEVANAARPPAPSEKVQTRPAARLQRSAEDSLRKEALAAPQPQPSASRDQAAEAPPAAPPAVAEASEIVGRSDSDASADRKAETDARAKTADTVGPASAPAAVGGVAREGSPLVAVGERTAQAEGPPVVRAPDSPVRWRVRNAGIERSVDGGLTWSAESSPIAADVTMGAAPTAGVCWLASPSGQVLRRAETGAWTDVSPAPRVAISELTAVTKASAVIVSPDGTRLRTRDAGRTWIREERR